MSGNSNNNRITLALNNWQDMPIEEKPTLIKTFAAGLNHETYLISSNDQKAVLKLFSEPSYSAITMQKFASAYKIAPEVYYVNKDFDLALLEYINSETVTENLSSQDLISLAKALRKLHSLTAPNISSQLGNFDLLAFYDSYLAAIPTKDSLAHRIHEQIQPIIIMYLNDTTQWCLCHNDLVQENCFIFNQNALFIDWEFAQQNNPWFDLAAIIYYFHLDIRQSTFFLNAYQPTWESKVTKSIYTSSQVALLWADMLWHLARSKGDAWPDLKNKLDDLSRLAKQLNIDLIST